MKTYVTRYRVTPINVEPDEDHLPEFPLDMLRQDQCYPAQQDDVVLMEDVDGFVAEDSLGEQKPEIELVHVGGPEWTPARRWQSFGWGVVPGSIRTVEGGLPW